MAQQTINVGAAPNDGTGTPLRTAFQYTNSNFTELYTAVGPSGNNIVVPGTATITGDLTVDTSTLKVDSANDRVGIGTATPAAKLIVRDGTNRNLLVASDATQLGSAGIAIGGFTDNAAGYAPLSLLASAMQFGIGGSTAMTLNSTGLNVANGNVILGTSGKGIDFSATASGSGTMSSELFSDYEEGTWTPVVTAGTGTLTSVTGQTGAYTKVGRMVVVTGFFTVTTNGTGGSFLSVAGLPFTNGNLSNIAVGRIDGTTGEMFQGKLNPATNVINLWKYDNSYPAADGAQFPMTLTYYV